MPTLKQGHISPSDAEDAVINAHAIEDDTLFTDEELAKFRPAHEVLPLELQKVLGMKPRGRPAGSGETEQIAIRIQKEALARWRATGKGWQTRAAAVLAEHAP